MGSRHLLPAFLTQVDFFTLLAKAGFVVASIDYRLSSEAIWPAPVLDARAAVRWIRRRATQLGVNPDAIAVWGESAGGYLAAMVGVLSTSELPGEVPGLPFPSVAAVVDWYGPTDFGEMDKQAPVESAMSHDDAQSPESRLLGVPVPEAPQLVAAASPVTYARAGLPPMLVCHGRNDRLVPFGQSEILVAALERNGSPVRFVPVDGADHVFEGHPNPRIFVDQAIAFLLEVLPTNPRDERVTDEQH